MTIGIKGLELRKDTTKIHSTPKEEARTLIPLVGEIELEVSHGKFKGQDFIDVSKISTSLQEKLYNVLNEIEKELENVEPIKVNPIHIENRIKWNSAKESSVEKEVNKQIGAIDIIMKNMQEAYVDDLDFVKCELQSLAQSSVILKNILENASK